MTETAKVWAPVLAEIRSASADIKSRNPFLYKDVKFSDADYSKLRELVHLMVDEEQLLKFPTWSSRAQYLQVSQACLNTWRQTELYKQLLKGAAQLLATEGVLKALPKMISQAAEGSPQAFSKLTQLAGMALDDESEKRAATAVTLNANFSLEGMVKQIAEQSRVVDAP